MRYAEINLLGVYVAPIAPMIVAAWLLLIPIRRLAEHFGLLRFVCGTRHWWCSPSTRSYCRGSYC